jgi:hypothetical protein
MDLEKAQGILRQLGEYRDAKWDVLLADPLTPEALDLLATERISEDKESN